MRRRIAPARSTARLLAALAIVFAFAPMSVTHATVYVVTLDGMSFTPATITIYEGDAIRFVNVGGSGNLHNVHADDDSFRCSLDCNTHNAPSTQPWQATVRFTGRLGTLGYYCEQHGNLTSGMRGSITVIERIFVDGFEMPAIPPAPTVADVD